MLIFPLPYIIIKSAELASTGNKRPVLPIMFLNIQMCQLGNACQILINRAYGMQN